MNRRIQGLSCSLARLLSKKRQRTAAVQKLRPVDAMNNACRLGLRQSSAAFSRLRFIKLSFSYTFNRIRCNLAPAGRVFQNSTMKKTFILLAGLLLAALSMRAEEKLNVL